MVPKMVMYIPKTVKGIALETEMERYSIEVGRQNKNAKKSHEYINNT